MALTPSEISTLISFNIPDNNQQLVTPAKVRAVLNEILAYAQEVQAGGQTLQGVTNVGNTTTNPIGYRNGDNVATLQAGDLTDDRELELPDEDGTVATREWVAANAGGGGGVDTGFPYDLPFDLGGGSPGGGLGTWGYIGGDIATQTDLQAALAAKADDAHTHAIDDVTGLQTALDGKQAAGSYAAASHTHSIANVTGLQTALDGKASSTHSHAITDVTGLQTALDGKQAAGSYAAATHGHAITDVTGLQTALDGKQAAGSYAAASHTHAQSDITGLVSDLAAKEDKAAWVDYSTTSTVVGWSGTPTKIIRYQLQNKRLHVQFSISGTSNSATTTFTLPNALASGAVGQLPLFRGINGGNSCIVFAAVTGSTVSFTIFDTISSIANFSSSGTKTIYGQFVIQLD